MKIRDIAIVVIVILVLCSPALAMSKADLLASYKNPGPDDLWTVAPHAPCGPCDYSDDNFPCNYTYSYPTPTPFVPLWVSPKPIPTLTPLGTEYLTVRSDPSFATVYFDGQFKGVTPLVLTGLSPGLHQLKLTKFGYTEYTNNVTILAGRSCKGNILPYPGCENWLPVITLQRSSPNEAIIDS